MAKIVVFKISTKSIQKSELYKFNLSLIVFDVEFNADFE